MVPDGLEASDDIADTEVEVVVVTDGAVVVVVITVALDATDVVATGIISPL